MADQRTTKAPKERSPEEAYQEAERRIARARRTGAKVLDLSELGLTALPPELGQLTVLKELRLGDNRLTALPPELGQLTALQSLYLGDNRLTALPPALGQLTALQSLSLRSNQLTALSPALGQLTALQQLALGNNQLTALPPELGQLAALQVLALSNNRLAALPPELGQLATLQLLFLNNNRLTALPPEFGQLRALQGLFLGNNQLTALPPELGALGALIRLEVDGNPLPTELQRLDVSGQLIDYLRATFKAASQAVSTGRFDEAKLLLVGPGEVGKTWLLQALQGHKPRRKGSTKGLEITREPLDLPHPREAGRVLHLNCWDFGGQDHYQITHQIFFSPKAIYLLVWKPRLGVDPDLAVRLERIKISAGKTAKVFIVSTHKDENVPAIFGKETLREHFGDLIGGFFEVDSARGPKGTGIAELRAAIADAAASLEGMDLPYPESWHKAQQAVRAWDKPTVTFREFLETCRVKGMQEVEASGLASIMDAQGNAVYFAEAADKGQAGVDAENNLLVLKPEWLAKAVAFVIEDEKTRERSGVLEHARLQEIWRKDPKRQCPGYEPCLCGYLLWLMWKFDIAYRLDARTSLVPEMIQHNRSGNLRWTPTMSMPAGERQVTLLCQIGQDPPLGLVPVLTAAVHPLRAVQQPGQDHDSVDRNWRDGFFLDTARRGAAFVELQDRTLHIVVRDKYPADLVWQVRRTLDQVIEARWPQLPRKYCVPCPGRVREAGGGAGGERDKPCRGTFLWDWLLKRRGETVPCQDCDSRDLEVDAMVDGIDTNAEKMFAQLRELKNGQASLMVAALRLYRDVMDPARSELERAPNMFSIMPADRGGWNPLARLADLAEVRVDVRCWCEHPDGPHPEVYYQLKMPKQWVITIAPYISWATALLKAFVPLAGDVVKQGLDGALPAGLKEQIDLMGDVGKALPAGKLETGQRDEVETMIGGRPEVVALRHIHEALLAQVPAAKRWGTLRAVRTKSRELLWLCEKHAAIQQPPVQNVCATPPAKKQRTRR